MFILGRQITLNLIRVQGKFYLEIDGEILTNPLDMKTGRGTFTHEENYLISRLIPIEVIQKTYEDGFVVDKYFLEELKESRIVLIKKGGKVVEVFITSKSSSHELIRAVIYSPEYIKSGEIFYGDGFYLEKGESEALVYARQFLMVI